MRRGKSVQEQVVSDSRKPAVSRPRDGAAIPMVLVGIFAVCAVLTLILMAGLGVRYALSPDRTATHLTAQAARMLQYWALLVWVHGIAGAWFRRAGSRRAGWRGFAGIVYLGCGYVFALALASVLDLCPCAEDFRTLVWLVAVPSVAWISGLLGCGLLLQAWSERQTPLTTSAAPQLEPAAFTARGFQVLVGASSCLSALATAIVAVRAGSLLSSWHFRSGSDRSADFLGVVVYGGVYLVASLAALLAAIVCARRAVHRRDRDLLWQAGVLALIGGLQQIVVLGWPAIIGGILAIRAANRRDRAAGGTP
jgi:hypothetical protein